MTDRLLAAGAALLWLGLGLRWFDVGATLAPAALQAIPVWLLAIPWAGLTLLWTVRNRGSLAGEPQGRDRAGLLLVVGVTVLFRLPMAWWGAVGYTTPDGALSGTVAQRIRDGAERFVFVPGVPYSGSLKSHLTAALASTIDLPRAFTLSSVAFYALFVAGLHRLALLSTRDDRGRIAVAAGLYAALAPPFVTRYSLSNDGNYVEVLALGTWAMVGAVRFLRSESDRGPLAFGIGLTLGLAFWCHILAVIHAAALLPVLLWTGRRQAHRVVPAAAAGFILGNWPALLWNAANGWESFRYLLPGGQPVGTLVDGPGPLGRLHGMIADQWPVLLGYDPGYSPGIDRVLTGFAAVAMTAVGFAFVLAARRAGRDDDPVRRLLLVFTVANLGIALAALPYIPGNPRYLLFLVTPVALLLAEACTTPVRRVLFAGLVAGGALASLAQWPGTARSDARWRLFAAGLKERGVTHCYTDFNLSAKLHLVSEGRLTCSSALGPTTTEYFRDDAARVDAAASAAFITVNTTAAGKIERRLARLGVTYRRDDLLKPVFFALSRKVRPDELFPREVDQSDSDLSSVHR